MWNSAYIKLSAFIRRLYVAIDYQNASSDYSELATRGVRY